MPSQVNKKALKRHFHLHGEVFQTAHQDFKQSLIAHLPILLKYAPALVKAASDLSQHCEDIESCLDDD